MLVVVVLVGALVPHFDGTFVATLAANADALRVVAAVAKGGCAARADPFVAALMAFFLFFKALFERVHQLVPAHFLDGSFLLGREFLLQDFFKPVEGHFFGEVGQHLHALEVSTKGFVKLVEVLFVLDHHRAGQVVKIVDAAGVRRRADHIGLQGFEQGQVLAHRHRQFGGAQGVEKVDQHDRGSSVLARLN